jgi:hypothetical protein
VRVQLLAARQSTGRVRARQCLGVPTGRDLESTATLHKLRMAARAVRRWLSVAACGRIGHPPGVSPPPPSSQTGEAVGIAVTLGVDSGPDPRGGADIRGFLADGPRQRAGGEKQRDASPVLARRRSAGNEV